MSWKINGNAAVMERQGSHEGHPVGPSTKEAMQEQHHLLPLTCCLRAPMGNPCPAAASAWLGKDSVYKLGVAAACS